MRSVSIVLLLLGILPVGVFAAGTAELKPTTPSSTSRKGTFRGRVWQRVQMKGGVTNMLDIFQADGTYLDTIMTAFAQPHRKPQWVELTGTYRRTYIPPARAIDTQIRLTPVNPKDPKPQGIAGGYAIGFDIASSKPVAPNDKQIEWERTKLKKQIETVLGKEWDITISTDVAGYKAGENDGAAFLIRGQHKTKHRPKHRSPAKGSTGGGWRHVARFSIIVQPLGSPRPQSCAVLGHSTIHTVYSSQLVMSEGGREELADQLREALDARWVTEKDRWFKAETIGSWPDRNQPRVRIRQWLWTKNTKPLTDEMEFIVQIQPYRTLAKPPVGWNKNKRIWRGTVGSVDIRQWTVPHYDDPKKQVPLAKAYWIKSVRVGFAHARKLPPGTTDRDKTTMLLSYPIPVWPVGADPSKPEVSQELVRISQRVSNVLMGMGYGVGQVADDAPDGMDGKVRSMRIHAVGRKQMDEILPEKRFSQNMLLWITPKQYQGGMVAGLSPDAPQSQHVMHSPRAKLFRGGKEPSTQQWRKIAVELKKLGFTPVK